MNSNTLATLFTPHLLCPRKLSPEALHTNSQNLFGLVSFMISKGEQLFEVPPKLMTDIRAFWVEQEKKLLSPKKPDVSEIFREKRSYFKNYQIFLAQWIYIGHDCSHRLQLCRPQINGQGHSDSRHPGCSGSAVRPHTVHAWISQKTSPGEAIQQGEWPGNSTTPKDLLQDQEFGWFHKKAHISQKSFMQQKTTWCQIPLQFQQIKQWGKYVIKCEYI